MSGYRLHRALRTKPKLKLIEEENNDQRSQDVRSIHRRHIIHRCRRHLRPLRRAKAQAAQVLAVLFTLRTETKVRVQARLSGQLLLSVQSSQQRRYIPHSFLGLVTEKPKENMKVHVLDRDA